MRSRVKWLLTALFMAHGSIHSLGFIWAFDLAEISELGGPSLLIPDAVAFPGAGWAVAAGSGWWPKLAAMAGSVSLVPTVAWWDDAWGDALISLAILVMVALAGERWMLESDRVEGDAARAARLPTAQ